MPSGISPSAVLPSSAPWRKVLYPSFAIQIEGCVY
jgi:hypothetical protein